MANIKQPAKTTSTAASSKLSNAVEAASSKKLLSEEGVQALTDGDISRADKQMANEVLAKAFDKAGAAGAKQDVPGLSKAVSDAETAKQLADATVQQFYKENPSMGAEMMAKLGGFIDSQTLSLHKTTLQNLGGR